MYTVPEYIQRKTALEARKTALDAEIDKLSRPTPDAVKQAILPAIERVLDAYHDANTDEKNALLRSVVDRVVYHKTRKGGELILDVFPCVSI